MFKLFTLAVTFVVLFAAWVIGIGHDVETDGWS